MLTVHHLGVSASERIVWLCEELGIDYALKHYERDPVTRLAPADYKALHPLETAPIITDGDICLAESGAIVEYIIARHGDGRLRVGQDDPAFPDYLFWFHFSNASMVASGMGELIAGILGAGDAAMPLVRARSDRAHALVEKRLGEAPWFAGETFSAADIMMVFALTTMRNFIPRDFTPYPNIRAYLRRVAARPAYRRAMEKGDPGMKLLLD
ncbi:glutathione S-transferase family protein [Sandaracinobacteroides sp. A072]|uniref:glutathione S-transferase family protein n=1 Tax=Sandaracinobacteroides sp. A072 TaxID=3461146 RepID=UPI0040436844